jgi:hypothetical protein
MPDWLCWIKRIRWLATCLFFFVLPCLLLAFVIGTTWARRERALDERIFRRLDGVLLRLRERENTGIYLRDQWEALRRRARQATAPEGILAQGIRAFNRRFPGLFSVVTVGRDGTVLPHLSRPQAPASIFKRLFEGLQFTERARRVAALKPMQKVLQHLIGSEVTIEQLPALTMSFQPVRSPSKDRYFAYVLDPAGGLFIHASHRDDWDLLALKDQCDLFSRRRASAPLQIGLFEFGSTVATESSFVRALTDFQRNHTDRQVVGDRLFVFMNISHSATLWASSPRPRSTFPNQGRWLLVLFCSLVVGLASLVSSRIMVGDEPFRLSIRIWLVVVFGFASGLPLLLTYLLGWAFLDYRVQIRTQETHDHLERSLRAVDGRYPQLRRVLERRLRSHLAGLSAEQFGPQPSAELPLLAIKRSCGAGEIMVYDRRGHLVWDARPNRSEKAEKSRRAVRQLAMGVLAHLNQEDPSKDLGGTTMVFEALTGGKDPIGQLVHGLGTIIPFHLGKVAQWSYTYPLADGAGRSELLIIVTWSDLDLERFFLKRELGSARRTQSAARFFAAPQGQGSAIPHALPPGKDVQNLLRHLSLRQLTTAREIFVHGEWFLATGIKPRFVNSHFLVAVMPKRPIQAEAAALRRWLWLAGTAVLLLTMYLGHLLSNKLLKPIQNLSAGVLAIEGRDFQHRISVEEGNELGDLSRTFNDVMVGLSELEIGRIVQESLFPQGELAVGAYRVCGATWAASELGGDYFDLRSLADGKMMILIGDVSGHGVGAALVMAMAKVLVERELEENPEPKSLLDSLHRILFRTLKRRKMMSCFLAILDPATDTLAYSNAGHNFPILFRRGTQPFYLELPAFPLGSMRNNTFKSACQALEPGDQVLFYTDGLIEATTLRGGTMSYELVIEHVPGLLTKDPTESVQRIRDWQISLCGSGRQEDDITLVSLSRDISG